MNNEQARLKAEEISQRLKSWLSCQNLRDFEWMRISELSREIMEIADKSYLEWRKAK